MHWPSPLTYGETASGPSSQYNGRVFDPGTGFHDYGARMYWPQIGRFISADSYAGTPGDPASLNRYCYVNNNPYKYTDPTGHCPMCIGAAIGAVGGGILAGYYSYQAGVRGEGLVGDILFGIGAGGLVGGTLGAGAAALPALLNRSSALQRLGDTVQAAEGEAAAVGNELGILRDAAAGKGNFGVGQANASTAQRLGNAWVGEGSQVASDGKTLLSGDGLRQFRPPSLKPSLDRVQANFEARPTPEGAWQSNAHLDVIPEGSKGP
jgi:RHS repeat-associated protein